MQFYLDQPQPSMVTLTGVLVFCMVVGDAMLVGVLISRYCDVA